jgi:hypothetical protein
MKSHDFQPSHSYDLPIHTDQAWEVDYWCWVLDVSEHTLKAAVAAVGPRAANVKHWLDRRAVPVAASAVRLPARIEQRDAR